MSTSTVVKKREVGIVVKHRKVGIAAQKMRPVCNLIRKKPASEALKKLRFCEKREIAIVLTKLINSGLEIANNSQKYDLDNLIIRNIMVDEGSILKRLQPRAKGRACKIQKKTGHITIELGEK